ncbi:MAG: LacI family DNA-binding transcriptional regulator [Acidobacteriaceae bacterium]|nr:LacI family DNA-binding transcriptional regulator [Acidobacteriaceae bacterium]
MSTIKEVAKRAGVSIGTVSHFLGGSVPVSNELRRRISAAIEALDYHPNHVARSLKTSKTRMIGIVVPDFGIPFFSKVIRSVEEAVGHHGYFLLAASSDDDTARQDDLLLLLRSQRVEGILLVSASGEGSELQIRKIVKSGIPVVCLDRLPDNVEVDSVSVEDHAAAEMGVSHLISSGHRNIAVITGPLTLRNERERLKGYKSALQAAGLKVSPSLIWETSLQQEDIIRVCKKALLRASNRPSALFCSNGVVGLAALKTIAACKLSTQNDIAFATFDELVEHDIFHPSITSVIQPAREIGSCAAEMLIARIQSPATRPRHVRLPATLKIGESSNWYRPKLARVLHGQNRP